MRRASDLLPVGVPALLTLLAACGGDGAGPPVGPEEPDSTPAVSTIELRPPERTIGILGIPVGMRALALSEDGDFLYGSFLDPDRFSWTSSAPGVATVDEALTLVTGVSEGTATITAASEGVTGSTTVTVRDHARVGWSVPLGTGSITSAPAIGADGTIYVGSDDFAAARSRWYAVSPQGGVLWTLDLPLTSSTPAVASDGTLYLGSRTGSGAAGFTGRLIAVDPGGAVRWMLEGLDGIRSSPVLGPDGTIYVAGDHHVYAVDPHGEIQWTFESGEGAAVFVFSSPAIARDGTIYLGGADHLMYAINPDGTAKWTFEATDVIQSSPSIGSDGTIYFGSVDGRFYAVGPDGAERWSVDIGASAGSSPSVGPDGTIYVGATGGVFALDPTGSIRWNYDQASGSVWTTPILGANGSVYIGAGGGIIALDAQGRLLWDYGTGDRAGASPAIGVDGTIVWTSFSVNSYAGALHAIFENGSGNGGFAGAHWPQERGNRANSGRAGG